MSVSKASTSDKTRVTLDLSTSGYKRLQRLVRARQLTGAAVLRQALKLYEYCVDQAEDGARFKIVDKEGNESEIEFVAFLD